MHFFNLNKKRLTDHMTNKFMTIFLQDTINHSFLLVLVYAGKVKAEAPFVPAEMEPENPDNSGRYGNTQGTTSDGYF